MDPFNPSYAKYQTLQNQDIKYKPTNKQKYQRNNLTNREIFQFYHNKKVERLPFLSPRHYKKNEEASEATRLFQEAFDARLQEKNRLDLLRRRLDYSPARTSSPISSSYSDVSRE